ncbi:MAG: lipoprotein [Akkermansia sp.]|nr:lipoprotein [Akkermansia sp.]
MKKSILPICAAFALSSCYAPLTFNLHELVAPPDARVAMAEGLFPGRAIDFGNEEHCVRVWSDAYSTDIFAPCSDAENYLYEWNHILYQKRYIQYAVANRPIIRRDDVAEAPALHIDDHNKQFTIDKSIPTEIWMQPVSTDETAVLNNERYVCIPAEQFDFKRAKKVKKTSSCRSLCALPLNDKPGTESPLRVAASIPLELVDGIATLSFFAAEGCLYAAMGLISFPIDEIIYAAQPQQQHQQFEQFAQEAPSWKK